MENYAKKITYQGEPCVELCSSGYCALFAPGIGGMILRLRDMEKNYEILHFSEDISIEEIKEASVLYGQTLLYLPNRLEDGVLKTSDSVYQMPINEVEFNTHLHGFLHKRSYTLTNITAEDDFVSASAEYIYDEKDEMFKFLPLKFKAEITYIVSKKGLEQKFKITNLSEKVLPIGIGSHTSINCTFSQGSEKCNSRMQFSVDKSVLFNQKRWLCTGELAPMDDFSKKFADGTINPATTVIDNYMFTAKPQEIDGENLNCVKFYDAKTGKTICYQAGEMYKFWLCWNKWAQDGFCCPEPMTWMTNAPNIDLPNEVTGYKEIKTQESFDSYQRIFSE